VSGDVIFKQELEYEQAEYEAIEDIEVAFEYWRLKI
jgi:hypothetical protein